MFTNMCVNNNIGDIDEKGADSRGDRSGLLIDVMAYIAYQRAAGDAKYAQVYTMSPSASKTQMVTVIGMRHKF